MTELGACGVCGAEIREGSLFCYSCGRSVAPADETPDSVSMQDENSAAVPVSEMAAREIRREPDETDDRERRRRKNAGKVRRPGEMETAASIRRRERRAAQKPAEVVWEQSAGFPTAFVVITAVLFVVVLAIFYFGVYLK